MRETVVAVVAVALLVTACEGKTNPSTPPGARSSSPAAAAPTTIAAPARSPKRAKKTKKASRVARKTQKATTAKARRGTKTKAGEVAAKESPPTLMLNQAPLSSY